MTTQAKRKKKTTSKERKSSRKWSGRVTQTSDALDLQPKVFKSGDPASIARSLKRSAEKSQRKKGTPFQSAMSILTFYINRAGKNLSDRQKSVLEKAKEKLRELFDRPLDDS